VAISSKLCEQSVSSKLTVVHPALREGSERSAGFLAMQHPGKNFATTCNCSKRCSVWKEQQSKFATVAMHPGKGKIPAEEPHPANCHHTASRESMKLSVDASLFVDLVYLLDCFTPVLLLLVLCLSQTIAI
jgi:hypothetical protein